MKKIINYLIYRIKQIRIIYLALFISVLFNGCDCISEGNGVVVDEDTNTLLANVVAKSYKNKVKNRFYEGEMITDSTGVFTGSTGLTGGFFSCPDLVVQLSKNGYETKVVTYFNDTIKLSK